jgi:hypothetical protein
MACPPGPEPLIAFSSISFSLIGGKRLYQLSGNAVEIYRVLIMKCLKLNFHRDVRSILHRRTVK